MIKEWMKQDSEGVKCDAGHSEKGWVEVTILNKQ